jgi:putative ABC transport system permease protein
MGLLDKKLVRDLGAMRGAATAIALIIACGVATFVMSASTLDSLTKTRDAFYNDFRFAHVFARLKRAPETLQTRIEEIPGVARAETRVVAPVKIEIDGFEEPITGELISLPDSSPPLLNGLYLKAGRLPAPFGTEVAVVDTFATAHSLHVGDSIEAIVNGKRRKLVVSGIALSPEFVFQISPGAIFPDFERFGILWMGRNALSAAFDMEGAFNNVTLSLDSDAVENGTVMADVIDRLDRLLEPYGGFGAHGRKDQVSNHVLAEEFKMLGNMSVLFPAIFLSVAAFLLNIVVKRLITTQRNQIAILKAFGYSNTAIGVHYVKLVSLITLAGASCGIALGSWLGNGLSELYMDFYRFPYLKYHLGVDTIVISILICFGATIAGTLSALRRAVIMAPAEAMRPEPPQSYNETLLERAGLKEHISVPSRMILRHIERQPVKSLLTVTGIALACAIMMVGSFQKDAVGYMVDVQFKRSQKEDVSVVFTEPTGRRALFELANIEGVRYAEPYRSVPARLRFEHRSYRTSIEGVDPNGDLHRVLDSDLKRIDLSKEGVVLTDHLGKILGIGPGDTLQVEVLEGARPVLQVPVAGLTKQYMGLWAYMEIDSLNRLMREGSTISGAHIAAEQSSTHSIYKKLKEMPRVAGVIVRLNSIKNFYDTMADTILLFTYINTLLAATIAFGVVYNSARIALSERSRELASLRVMGFTRAEISYILIGELAVLTLVAIPIGFLIGRALCSMVSKSIESDLYRIPLIIDASTYSFATTVILLSATVSAVIIRRKLDHLDLVATLKTRE